MAKKNKAISKVQHRRGAVIKQIEETCAQWQAPAYIAVLILAGELKQRDLAGHPQREQWAAEYRQEIEPDCQPKQLKRLRAERIVAKLGFNLDEAFTVLSGVWTPATAVKRATERREAAARRERQKQLEARQRQWLAEAAAALQPFNIPTDLIKAILPPAMAVNPDLDAPAEAVRRWQDCLNASGFGAPAELIAAWQEHRVLTAERLRQARERQVKRLERQAERDAKRKELCYKSTAIQLLGLTPAGFDRLSAEIGLEPEKVVQNPHYRSAAPAKLYRRLTIEQLIDNPRVVALRPKERRSVDYAPRFIKRYGNDVVAATVDAAQAMFNLNRYAKHETCSARNRREIYGLKNDLIRRLYETGYCREARLHLKTLEAQECWNCDGTGVAYDDGVDTCYRCDGTGIYRGKRTLKFVVLRFVINDQPFTWHQRFEDVNFEVQLTGDKQEMPDIDVKPLEIPRGKLTEAKALVKWFLSKGRVPEQKESPC